MDQSIDESCDPLTPAEEAVLIARLAVMGNCNRDRYRKIRAAAWELVAANPLRSDFPSNSS